MTASCRRLRSASGTLSGNFAAGWPNTLASPAGSAIASHCLTTFSSRKFGGISLSFSPCFSTSVSWSSSVRHLVQARDVILIVLGAVERHRRDELRKRQMHAVELVERHLVQLQIGRVDVVAELAHHQLLIEPVLFAEARGVDRLEARKECRGVFLLLLHMRDRRIRPLVVVAIVAEDGRELRRFLEVPLPLLGEQIIERLHARRHVRGRRRECGRADGAADGECHRFHCHASHRCSLSTEKIARSFRAQPVLT